MLKPFATILQVCG